MTRSLNNNSIRMASTDRIIHVRYMSIRSCKASRHLIDLVGSETMRGADEQKPFRAVALSFKTPCQALPNTCRTVNRNTSDETCHSIHKFWLTTSRYNISQKLTCHAATTSPLPAFAPQNSCLLNDFRLTRYVHRPTPTFALPRCSPSQRPRPSRRCPRARDSGTSCRQYTDASGSRGGHCVTNSVSAVLEKTYRGT